MAETALIEATGTDDYVEAARLFRAYAETIAIDLEFQGFSRELAALPGDYAPPHGLILLALADGRTVGCVALRRLEEGICEMKRMYVAPEGRGLGLGRRLADEVIDRAVRLGYRKMRLDTLRSMTAARALYRSLGFEPIPPYCHNPLPDPEFYELDLTREKG